MLGSLISKLHRGAHFSDADIALLERLSTATIKLPAQQPVLLEGGACEAFYVLVSGWACRYKTLPGQSRQIIGFLLPGDHIWLDRSLAQTLDYGVHTLTPCEIAETPMAGLADTLAEHPSVRLALRRAEIVDEAILRQWLVGLGRRPAERRMAHLLCELLTRLQAVGLAEPNACPLPLSQRALGDALGLSSAHVNRSLQSLRARQLLNLERGVLTVESVEKLQRFAGFNRAYLWPGDTQVPH